MTRTFWINVYQHPWGGRRRAMGLKHTSGHSCDVASRNASDVLYRIKVTLKPGVPESWLEWP